MIIVFARQLNHLCRNTQSWHKKKLLHSDLWMPTFVQQDLWKAMSAAGIAAMKRCFLLSGTYITETVPWAAPLRACGLPDAVFLAISATSACRDLHLEGEEGGGERRFSSTALPPVREVADSSSVSVSLHPRHRGRDGVHGAALHLCLTLCVHTPDVGGKVLVALLEAGQVVSKCWGLTGEEGDRQTASTQLQHTSVGHGAAAWPAGTHQLPAQTRILGPPRDWDCTDRPWWHRGTPAWDNSLEIPHRIWSGAGLTLTAKAGAFTATASLHLQMCLCLERSESQCLQSQQLSSYICRVLQGEERGSIDVIHSFIPGLIY